MSQLNRIAARLAGAGGQQSSVTPSPIPQQPVGSSSAVERDGATLLVVNRLANATFPDVGEFVPPESPPTLDGVSFDKVQPINPFPPKPINPFTGNSPEQNAGCYTSVGGQCPKPPSDPTTPPSPPAPIRFNGMSTVAPDEFVWSGGQGIQTEQHAALKALVRGFEPRLANPQGSVMPTTAQGPPLPSPAREPYHPGTSQK